MIIAYAGTSTLFFSTLIKAVLENIMHKIVTIMGNYSIQNENYIYLSCNNLVSRKGKIGETNGTTTPHNEYSDFLQFTYTRHISES
jgi:hypothetical protein